MEYLERYGVYDYVYEDSPEICPEHGVIDERLRFDKEKRDPAVHENQQTIQQQDEPVRNCLFSKIPVGYVLEKMLHLHRVRMK